ncbi:hypothetical protein BJX70DRAFT_404048 [Aspergillus crustosus]
MPRRNQSNIHINHANVLGNAGGYSDEYTRGRVETIYEGSDAGVPPANQRTLDWAADQAARAPSRRGDTYGGNEGVSQASTVRVGHQYTHSEYNAVHPRDSVSQVGASRRDQYSNQRQYGRQREYGNQGQYGGQRQYGNQSRYYGNGNGNGNGNQDQYGGQSQYGAPVQAHRSVANRDDEGDTYTPHRGGRFVGRPIDEGDSYPIGEYAPEPIPGTFHGPRVMELRDEATGGSRGAAARPGQMNTNGMSDIEQYQALLMGGYPRQGGGQGIPGRDGRRAHPRAPKGHSFLLSDC